LPSGWQWQWATLLIAESLAMITVCVVATKPKAAAQRRAVTQLPITQTGRSGFNDRRSIFGDR
jgi:hypothetical protein